MNNPTQKRAIKADKILVSSYLRNFNLARINWELNQQEDRHFQQKDKRISSISSGFLK